MISITHEEYEDICILQKTYIDGQGTLYLDHQAILNALPFYLILIRREIMSATWDDKTRTSWCLEAVPRTERKWLSLLSLRFGTIPCNMIAIICFAWAMTQHIIGLVSTDGLGQTWAGINLGTVSLTHFQML